MPSGSAAMLARISASARDESAASAAVMVSSPYSSSSACRRRSPRSSALIWPLRSPQFDCGTRGVRGKDIDDVLLDDAGAKQLHRRDADALLEALGRLWIVVAGDVAADVEPVPTEAIQANTRVPRIKGRTRRKSLRWVPPS